MLDKFLPFISRLNKKERLVKMPLEHIKLFASMIEGGISPIDAIQSFGRKDYYLLLGVFISGGGYSQMFQKTTLGKHRKYLDLIESGERVGMVPKVLDDIAEINERNKQRNTQFIGILIYPIIILFITILLLVLVLYFVIPSILPIIKSAGSDLSVVTRVMIFFSQSLKTMKYVYISIPIVVGLCIIVAFKNKKTKSFFEYCLLCIPKINDMYINFNCLGYTMLLKSYVEYSRDIPDAFKKLGQDTSSEYFKKEFNNISELIQLGTPVSTALEQNNKLPKIWVVYARTGEISSTFVEVFNSLNKYYERTFNSQVQIIMRLSEPVLMIAIGTIVGIIAYGILSPIYGLMGQFK